MGKLVAMWINHAAIHHFCGVGCSHQQRCDDCPLRATLAPTPTPQLDESRALSIKLDFFKSGYFVQVDFCSKTRLL